MSVVVIPTGKAKKKEGVYHPECLTSPVPPKGSDRRRILEWWSDEVHTLPRAYLSMKCPHGRLLGLARVVLEDSDQSPAEARWGDITNKARGKVDHK